MSEETKQEEVVETSQQTEEEAPVEQAPVEGAPQVSKSLDLQYGFVVGVNQEGAVLLEMVGEKKGLVEMLGLCKYAEYHLNYTLDAASGQGAPIISRQIHQLAEMMKVLLNVIAQRGKPAESRIVTP